MERRSILQATYGNKRQVSFFKAQVHDHCLGESALLPWSQKPIPILPVADKELPSFAEAIGYMFLRNCGTLHDVKKPRATIWALSLEDLTHYIRVLTTNNVHVTYLTRMRFLFYWFPRMLQGTTGWIPIRNYRNGFNILWYIHAFMKPGHFPC